MAVGAGESEPVSAIEFPDQQGKYREIPRTRLPGWAKPSAFGPCQRSLPEIPCPREQGNCGERAGSAVIGIDLERIRMDIENPQVQQLSVAAPR